MGPYARVTVHAVDCDPASPLFLSPESHGRTSAPKSFADYVEAARDWKYPLHGLETAAFTKRYKRMALLEEAYALLERAREQYVRRRYQAAAMDAVAAIKLRPSGGSHTLAALAYRQTGCYADAIRHFQKAERLAPQDARTSFELANCYQRLKRPELADLHMKRGLSKVRALDALQRPKREGCGNPAL
jgi:tetratricopeptide (TPR) repeat protein